MTRDAFLVILFFVSLFIQTSLVHAASAPLALLPIHFLIGVIVLHRNGPSIGATWFLASLPLFLILGFDRFHPLTYVVFAATGFVMSQRLFTNRSVYALIGLGSTMYLSGILVNTVLAGPLRPPLMQLLRQELGLLVLLVLGLYLGFLAARALERFGNRFFFLKNHA